MLTRRFLLGAGGAALASAALPRMAFAKANTDRRFVFIIQRGAADGLSIVGPTGDPAHASLRGSFDQDLATGAKLDSFFTLHPALAETAKMYAAKQALFVHSVASPYRDRSHFDGQNVLETGGSAPYSLRDGWLNRLVGLVGRSRAEAIAFAPTVPLALRGQFDVASYAPSALPSASDDLLMRVGALYEHDAQLGPLWQSAMSARDMAGGTRARGDAAGIGKMAASFLAKADGPRIAMIETLGWDTHSGQNPRLATQLKALDAMLDALHEGLGPVWDKTTIVVATEFGRTAAVNGTGGTDHGTGTAAMLLGGAIRGGRVLADWPGLRPSDLYQGRDLRPTTSLDDVIAGAASETFGLDPHRTAALLFPQTKEAKPATGLVAA